MCGKPRVGRAKYQIKGVSIVNLHLMARAIETQGAEVAWAGDRTSAAQCPIPARIPEAGGGEFASYPGHASCSLTGFCRTFKRDGL